METTEAMHRWYDDPHDPDPFGQGRPRTSTPELRWWPCPEVMGFRLEVKSLPGAGGGLGVA
jgi:hypothetical protein